MARRRLLLLLKPLEAFPGHQLNATSPIPNPKLLKYQDNRRQVHKDAINFCQDTLRKMHVNWTPYSRSTLSEPIRDVDLVVTVGGDGTLLQASHFMDDTIPVLGVNSDPTNSEEVEEFIGEFDATRSTGYLCASTVRNFEQMVDNILEGRTIPSKLSRMSIHVNSKLLPTYALNDILIAHPSPATLSRFSFQIRKEGKPKSPLLNCRSSGLRISTATGSTAAMLSSGGFAMPTLSKDLQYIVREPILSRSINSNLMHGVVKSDESIETSWFCKEGVVFIDGSHVAYPVQYGNTVELSSNAPVLYVFLPNHAHVKSVADQN